MRLWCGLRSTISQTLKIILQFFTLHSTPSFDRDRPFQLIHSSLLFSPHPTKPELSLSLTLSASTMAALQQTPISLQTKFPPSAPLLKRTSTSSGLSFSAALPSIKLPAITHRSSSGAIGAKMAGTAAASYAAALVDIGKSNNTLDSTGDDVRKIEKIFSEAQILDFFVNPIIGIEKKREMLGEIAASSSLLPHTTNFLNILIDSKRIDLINEIINEFEAVFDKVTDTELAVVTSVVQLESQHLSQIAKQVQKLTGAKNVRIKTKIDPSLVAGFTIRYGHTGSKMIDMSVKKQLDDIAAQIDLGDIQLSV